VFLLVGATKGINKGNVLIRMLKSVSTEMIYRYCTNIDEITSNKLTFDLLTLKVVSESRVPILVFLGLCSRLRPDVRDRQTSNKSIA